ncbi:hypothetical protein FRB90_002259 [Tulasnella sp. 427]|nr:hypothetical protein FRB90_002259 [Tulasnella sp. 427]
MSASHKSTTSAKATTKAAASSAAHSPSFTTTDPSHPRGSTSRTPSATKAASGASHSPSANGSHSATGSKAPTLSTGGISTGSVFSGSATVSTQSVNTSIPTSMTFSAFMTPTGNLTSSIPTSTPPTTTIDFATSTSSILTSTSATTAADFSTLGHSSKMSVGAIVGTILGVVAGTLLVLTAALCLYRRRYLLRRAKERDFYGGASSTEYSNPFNDDKRYPSLMLEKDNAQRMYNYAMGNANANPNSASLLSPSTARDPFNNPRVRIASTSPPVLPYDGYASSPTVVDHIPSQPTYGLTEADIAASYPSAGRMSSFPKKSNSWRRSKSKKKKLADLKYRPNSTLTAGERVSARTLIRIESSSSNEDHRGSAAPISSYESGPRILRDVGRSNRSMDGHELRSQQSYASTQDGNHPFRFDRPPYTRDPSTGISSPPPVMDHRRIRSDETDRQSQTTRSQYLSPPQAPRRPPRPDSEEGSTFRGIANLLNARSANAPASPPSSYAPTPIPMSPSSPPPTARRPFATRSSPTNFENPRSPPTPSKPVPAHFVQRAAQPRGYNEPSGSRTANPGAMYFGRRSESVEDDAARSSESWHGGKAL